MGRWFYFIYSFLFLHISQALDDAAVILFCLFIFVFCTLHWRWTKGRRFFFYLLLTFTHCTGAGRRGGAGACN
jgi:hypothetical protein